jgi:HNH endonuclease
MGSWVHRLSSINYEEKTAVCSNCGPVLLRSIGYSRYGKKMWRCKSARVKEKRLREKPWIIFKKDSCEKCGFIPEHPCQLDVDHIDGNNANNDPKNLQTLCANCHRLKTYQNRDWENKVLEVEEAQVY